MRQQLPLRRVILVDWKNDSWADWHHASFRYSYMPFTCDLCTCDLSCIDFVNLMDLSAKINDLRHSVILILQFVMDYMIVCNFLASHCTCCIIIILVNGDLYVSSLAYWGAFVFYGELARNKCTLIRTQWPRICHLHVASSAFYPLSEFLITNGLFWMVKQIGRIDGSHQISNRCWHIHLWADQTHPSMRQL